jgi:hypothetical protein
VKTLIAFLAVLAASTVFEVTGHAADSPSVFFAGCMMIGLGWLFAIIKGMISDDI